MKINKKVVLFFVAALFLFASSLYLSKTSYLIDELAHFQSTIEIGSDQINSQTYGRNAQIPSYYYFMSLFVRLVPTISLTGFRLIQTFFSFLTIVIFYKIAALIDEKSAHIKTYQFLFFPFISIFYVLFYNDIFSLMVLLLSFYFLEKKRFVLSWIFALLSVLLRQNNIIWILFICCYHAYDYLSIPLTRKKVWQYVKECSGYGLSFIAIVLFMVVNGSPAMADPNANTFSLHVENPFFYLFTLSVLFLPVIVANVKSYFKFSKKNLLVFIICCALFPLFWYLFKADNWFNTQVFDFHLRNKIIRFVVSGTLYRAVFFMIICIAPFFLSTQKLAEKKHLLIYPFTLLFLTLSWLIEPRYYIIPITFFLLFRKNKKLLPEIILFCYFLVFSLWHLWGSAQHLFFW